MRSMRVTARSTGVIVGLTIAVLIGTGAMLAIAHSNSAARQQRLVIGSYETLALMRQAIIALQDTEIGQRAYLLSGEVSDLQPYERSRLRIETELRQLEAAAASDPDTMQQVKEFRAAANEKLDQLNGTITTYQLYGRDCGAGLGAHRSGPRDQRSAPADRQLLHRGAAAPAGAPADHAALGAGSVRHRRPAGHDRRVPVPRRRHVHRRAQRQPPGRRAARAG